ncbi:hypothetical protein CN221_14730 [Sinorhizobium meliloti]|uniref:hypothetical protein n=1 Tax=Rhizobium meliloti TaxID=382 RepID=UPI000FE054C0|nr:hypothetical protein [Sinorhizobium meliloti]RVG94830.1 hypothetical protein CN221_14730 [Sinorhizobium meliloti]RVH65458.1 hypothetical protein CN209_12675 [Sinorhizobium meliloti]
MHIRLSPQRRDDALNVAKAGDVLTINGAPFDFSALPDGAVIRAGEIPCDWIVGPVERVAGELRLTLILPHGPSPSQAVAFPALIIDPPDGPLALPADLKPAPAVDPVDQDGGPANVDG